MNVYILSQIFVIISTIILGMTYFAKTKKTVMLLCVIYCIFYGMHYMLLKAITGMIMIFISMIRNVWFYLVEKRGNKNNIMTLFLFVSISTTFGILSYQDIYSIMSVCANVTSTYSVWQSDVKKYRILAIPVSICFLAYAIHIESMFAIITESILLLLEIISLIKRDDKYEIC